MGTPLLAVECLGTGEPYVHNLDLPHLLLVHWFLIRPRKKMFVSCNGLKRNRVGRSDFFLMIFLFKNVCFMDVF